MATNFRSGIECVHGDEAALLALSGHRTDSTVDSKRLVMWLSRYLVRDSCFVCICIDVDAIVETLAIADASQSLP